MSWFKKKVESWDMVGKALERDLRNLSVEVAVDDSENEVVREVVTSLGSGSDLSKSDIAISDPNAKQLERLKNETSSILVGD